MAAKTAETINAHLDVPAFAIMSQECEKAINEFKDKVTILKMPKKRWHRLASGINSNV